MAETAPSWGHRFARLLSMLGLDFGTGEETQWAILRDAHRTIRWDADAMKAAAEDKDWPPLGSMAPFRHDQFRITLPSNEGVAEVRRQADGRFMVWVNDAQHPEGGYRSAWNFDTFEAAVRNLMDVLWPSCLPFESN